MAGGMVQSPSNSGIFFQGECESHAAANSLLTSNFGNSSNSLHRPNAGNTFLNSAASSIVTDANSGLSCGPHLQRSASINTESYMRLPASPISFSSNNNNNNNQGSSSDLTAMSQLRKKPRLDIKQEDIVHQEVLQQMLQRQGHTHMQSSNPQLQALMQQQRLRQQEHMLLQGMTPIQRAQFLQQQQQLQLLQLRQQQQQQQQQQLQLRQQLQFQEMASASAGKRVYEGGVCSRRLMQYLYHQRQRPADNTIAYWRKFVSEYYSPRAKKRWCLSMYDNVGHHSLGVFPQTALDAWQCDICGSKSGRGFEATFDVLPRLNEINFSSGVIDELLYLDLPRECRFPSGIMMLEYAKAVQESVYEQLRVVREGQLRILFTPDLKIFSWEFCARRHEELLSRRLLAPQVNQLLQVAQKCQSTISESGVDGVSQTDLKSNSALVVTAGRQLARSLELQSLNDLGFSKRYVRCLQVADVVNSMKDLMDFCREHKNGPIDALKNFPRRAIAPNIGMDQTGLNNLMSMNPGLNIQMNNNNQFISGRGGALGGSSQAALPISNYQKLLTRQNPVNSTNNLIQNEQSSRVLPNGILLHQNQSQPSGQALQQQMMQQYLQDMGKKNNGLSFSGSRLGGPGFGNSPANSAVGNRPCVVQSQQSSRSNSFKAGSSESESPAPGVLSQKGSDLPPSHYLSDDMVLDIAGEFTDDGFIDSDFRFD